MDGLDGDQETMPARARERRGRKHSNKTSSKSRSGSAEAQKKLAVIQCLSAVADEVRKLRKNTIVSFIGQN